jgi:hypothetical protein
MRNEVQEPQEGRWSPRRRTGPDVIETLRGSETGCDACAKPVRGGCREAGDRRVREEPLEGRSPREQRAARGDLSTGGQRTSGASKTQKPREDRGEQATSRSSERHVGKRPPRGGSRSAKGNASKGKAQERARHETRPWSSGEKQSARRADEPWRRNVPGEANPGRVGSPDRKRCRARNPKGGAATERKQRPALVKL